MDMVSYLSPWDDDYIPEGLIACHGTVVVAQIYEIWCGVIWYVCMVNMEVLVGKIQLTCQHVLLKFSRSLSIRSYKTWKCETCILLSSQWFFDIVRPKSTYGLDHDFKYIVSQDFSRVKKYWKWDVWHLIYGDRPWSLKELPFPSFSNISMFLVSILGLQGVDGT